MKRVLLIAVAAFALLTGCRNAGENQSPPVPAAVVTQATRSDSQSPYYYGLIEEYQTLLAEDPNNLAAILALGHAYYDSGQWREAIPQYERALALDPRNADVHTDMGTAYRNIGKPGRALAEYRLALKLDQSHVNARYNMGVVYANDLKDYAAAIRIWEELLRVAPNFPQADYLRTSIAAFKNKLKRNQK